LVETNLLKYPFNLLLNNRLDELLEEAAKRKKSHIVCEVLMPDGTKRVWMVNPSIQFGYPRPFDKKVFITVLKLVSDEGDTTAANLEARLFKEDLSNHENPGFREE
jgi:hypothetical protein